MALSVFVLPTLLYFAAFQGAVTAQVEVHPSYKVVKLGEPITMLCRGKGQLGYCRINMPGEQSAQILIPNQPPSQKKLRYEGKGLEDGECGFRIDRAEDIHNGVWKCYFHLVGQSEEVSGNMTLIVAHTPMPVEMIVNQDSVLKESDPFVAKCVARNSRPPTNFTWYIGDDRLTEGLYAPVYTAVSADGSLLTTTQNISRNLQWSDNGKEIKCVADHFGLDERNKVGRRLLNINYPPKRSDRKFEQFGLEEGSEGRVSVLVDANPRPSFIWNVGEMAISEGESQDRFSVLKATKQGLGSWETVLIIRDLTKEDTDLQYTVKANNGLGEETYYVQISTSPEPPKVLPIGAGPVVIIVVIVVLVFIIIGGVLFARAKGRWCFAGQVAPRIAGESSDTESADHTASEGKQKKSFISVFKKTNDKVMTIPEETLKSEDKISEDEKAKETDKALSPLTQESIQQSTTESPKNQPVDNGEGVVYAELDIQGRNTAGPTIVRGEDDKTEYAEIIHMKSQPK